MMDPNRHHEHTMIIEEQEAPRMQIDPSRDRFPCSIVWTPLPILSCFVPFIGHIGICREDGVILDFAGPNYVCVDNFTFGRPTCYFQIGKEQDSASYESEDGYQQGPNRDTRTWDDALQKSTQEFQHQSYNLLTCNCHSFVANCLNRLRFRGGRWNVVNLAIFILLNGKFVNRSCIVKTYLPFLIVFSLGLFFGGTTFLTSLAVFFSILIGWFLLGTYGFKKLIYV
ncbi:OLC1v1010953C1 [Oldenlandia corymbosa var. corymbosa]|uniref:OLC1v1010953C1 n=1 Tax=Oldenlandia corymbosa var. corymbosa TaxID=529605 RepID=A0AAV1DSM6_OLDCO|nr:OLC1v1010953C1 [Oldenlandia corymbosa var. corymbosa]